MTQYTDTQPSINKTAFSCPHCNALTTQYWKKLYLDSYVGEIKTPNIPDMSTIANIENDLPAKLRERVVRWAKLSVRGKPFRDVQEKSRYLGSELANVNVSECFNCGDMAIWVHEQLIYPSKKLDILPNKDLPPQVIQLFDEAREIVSSSPKGAAALLRLSIQHLCKELGGDGKSIDKDIATLVINGLSPMIQKALDIVRVIGNEAVHPGTIDLNDNRDIAYKLFDLINLIAHQMITHPKAVDELYAELPENKLKGIELRDKK